MPTVWREAGFRFMIYPDDHDPPHVHVFKGGGEVVVDLADGKSRDQRGLRQADVLLAKAIVRRRHAELVSCWEMINGRE